MERIDIEQLRQKLELQRQEISEMLSRIEHERRSLGVDSAKDSADGCVTGLPLLEWSSQQRTLLGMIEAALRRIADGSFGVCVTCTGDIDDRWLDALPWAKFCLRCQVREHIRRELFGPDRRPPPRLEGRLDKRFSLFVQRPVGRRATEGG